MASRRLIFAILVGLAPGLALAQPPPPPPPPRATAPAPRPPRRDAPAKPETPVVRAKPDAPVVRAKPDAPVVRAKPDAPVVRPKPSTPPRRPPAPTAAVAPIPVPLPAPVPDKPTEPLKGSVTGLLLPRFVALRSDEVYMRLGPGKRYPIEWVYKRRDLPMQIEREFEEWRLVRDPDNTKGWVHQATLAPRRSGIVIGGEQVLRRDPSDTSAPVARLKPGVIVRLRSCEVASDWCQTQVQDYRGWMKRTEVWGILPGEGIQ